MEGVLREKPSLPRAVVVVVVVQGEAWAPDETKEVGRVNEGETFGSFLLA